MIEITKSKYMDCMKNGMNVKRTKGRYWLLDVKEVKVKKVKKRYSSVRW